MFGPQGWAEVGWHRPANYTEVQTPVLDELAATGVKLEFMHSYMFCSPTRSAIQSGRSEYGETRLCFDPPTLDFVLDSYPSQPSIVLSQHLRALGYSASLGCCASPTPLGVLL
jgi:arylsulfatase A-like enzyme